MGYLLCRVVDTFEDAETLLTPQKARYLRELLDGLEAARVTDDWLAEALSAMGAGVSAADAELLSQLNAVLQAFESLPERDRQAIHRCVREMATGMVEMQGLLDHSKEPMGLRVLPDLEALTRYCHYVAGIVGTLLTELAYLNSPVIDKDRYFDLLHRSEAFGQYLQKINILKDIPGDHAKGWCFIPRSAIAEAGLEPEPLLHGEGERRVRAIAPVMRDVLRHAKEAWQYLNLVPLPEREYRLFLAYSFFFGVATVALGLKDPDRSFEGNRPLKISRLEVAAIIARVNGAIDDPEALQRSLRSWLEDAQRDLDPRWPAAVSQALTDLVRHLETALSPA